MIITKQSGESFPAQRKMREAEELEWKNELESD